MVDFIFFNVKDTLFSNFISDFELDKSSNLDKLVISISESISLIFHSIGNQDITPKIQEWDQIFNAKLSELKNNVNWQNQMIDQECITIIGELYNSISENNILSKNMSIGIHSILEICLNSFILLFERESCLSQLVQAFWLKIDSIFQIWYKKDEEYTTSLDKELALIFKSNFVDTISSGNKEERLARYVHIHSSTRHEKRHFHVSKSYLMKQLSLDLLQIKQIKHYRKILRNYNGIQFKFTLTGLNIHNILKKHITRTTKALIIPFAYDEIFSDNLTEGYIFYNTIFLNDEWYVMNYILSNPDNKEETFNISEMLETTNDGVFLNLQTNSGKQMLQDMTSRGGIENIAIGIIFTLVEEIRIRIVNGIKRNELSYNMNLDGKNFIQDLNDQTGLISEIKSNHLVWNEMVDFTKLWFQIASKFSQINTCLKEIPLIIDNEATINHYTCITFNLLKTENNLPHLERMFREIVLKHYNSTLDFKEFLNHQLQSTFNCLLDIMKRSTNVFTFAIITDSSKKFLQIMYDYNDRKRVYDLIEIKQLGSIACKQNLQRSILYFDSLIVYLADEMKPNNLTMFNSILGLYEVSERNVTKKELDQIESSNSSNLSISIVFSGHIGVSISFFYALKILTTIIKTTSNVPFSIGHSVSFIDAFEFIKYSRALTAEKTVADLSKKHCILNYIFINRNLFKESYRNLNTITTMKTPSVSTNFLSCISYYLPEKLLSFTLLDIPTKMELLAVFQEIFPINEYKQFLNLYYCQKGQTAEGLMEEFEFLNHKNLLELLTRVASLISP